MGHVFQGEVCYVMGHGFFFWEGGWALGHTDVRANADQIRLLSQSFRTSLVANITTLALESLTNITPRKTIQTDKSRTIDTN